MAIFNSYVSHYQRVPLIIWSSPWHHWIQGASAKGNGCAPSTWGHNVKPRRTESRKRCAKYAEKTSEDMESLGTWELEVFFFPVGFANPTMWGPQDSVQLVYNSDKYGLWYL